MKSIDGIRQKKKFFWDQIKNDHRYWLATNMMGEAFLGFGAFNTKKITGADTIDFIKNRQLIAEGALNNEAYFGRSPRKTAGEVRRVAYQKGGVIPPFFYSMNTTFGYQRSASEAQPIGNVRLTAEN